MPSLRLLAAVATLAVSISGLPNPPPDASVGPGPFPNTTGSPGPRQKRAVDAACTDTHVRKPWGQLTSDEQSDYIQAELCLQSASEQLGVAGAQSLWDDLQYAHIYMKSWIHFVGSFLPWHRYYVLVHENLLRSECGYNGSFPYWDEPYDAANGILNSVLVSDTAMGGNGSGSDGCITTGPFVNLTLHLKDNEAVEDYCLSRSFSDERLGQSSTGNVSTCLAETTYEDMWHCIEMTPHSGGHGGVGGIMTNVAEAAGDPFFFLHHGWVDALWASWQAADPDNRTYWIGGTNLPSAASNFTGDFAAFLDYDGDPANTTTLNHTLSVAGLAANVTAYDVMNISSVTNCATYVYADDL